MHALFYRDRPDSDTAAEFRLRFHIPDSPFSWASIPECQTALHWHIGAAYPGSAESYVYIWHLRHFFPAGRNPLIYCLTRSVLLYWCGVHWQQCHFVRPAGRFSPVSPWGTPCCSWGLLIPVPGLRWAADPRLPQGWVSSQEGLLSTAPETAGYLPWTSHQWSRHQLPTDSPGFFRNLPFCCHLRIMRCSVPAAGVSS